MTFKVVCIVAIALVSGVASAQNKQVQRGEPRGRQSIKHAAKRKNQQIIAYVSPSKGTVNVVRKYRDAAATSLRAQKLSDSEWSIQSNDKTVRLKVTMFDGSTLKDEDEPKVGDTDVAANCKCTGNSPMQDTGCVAHDVGSERVVRLGYSTCERATGSSCPQTYTDVTWRYKYSDARCQNQTVVKVLQQAWVCLP